MESWSNIEPGPLVQRTLAVLRENAGFNRSGLPPFKLPQIAQQIISDLIEFAATKNAEPAATTGHRLGQEGLALESILSLTAQLLRELLARQANSEQILSFHDYMQVLIRALSTAGAAALQRQRDELQGALERALRSRENDLRRLIQELSTPIMPIHDRILVLPLIGHIDEERAHSITERLLTEITHQKARIVIIDITGVPQMDRVVTTGLLRAAQAAQLLGAKVLLVGIRPEIALTMTQLEIDLSGLSVLDDLRSGIEQALGQQGYVVQRATPVQGMPKSKILPHL